MSAFLPLAESRASVDETVAGIKSLPTADAPSKVLVPRERRRRCEAERHTPGVPLGPKVWRELSEIGGALGVPVPVPGPAA